MKLNARKVGELRALLVLLCASTLQSTFAAEPPVPMQPDELGVVESLPAEVGPHWVWVSDMVWNAMTDGRATLVDADSGEMLGMISTGYSFNSLSIPANKKFVYSAETYYTRYTRGDRTDVVTIYDTVDLRPTAEIEIPPKRASTTPKLSTAGLTDDDRFLAVWNFTPASSLSIVDMEAQKFVGEAVVSGCALAYAAGDRQFFSLCGNGTLMLITLDDAGAVVDKQISEPFFDVEADPITEKGVRLGDDWFFPSFNGDLYTVDVSGDDARFTSKWPLTKSKDRRDNWRIGGLQHLALHAPTARLYALMHQGGPDTHNNPGNEVWVYDLNSRKRIERFELQTIASSIQVSQDDSPLLFTVEPGKTELVVYDALTGEHQKTIPEISLTPSLLQLPAQ